MVDSNLKISIIVPVYNVSSYLVDCLESIRKQSYSNWECICIDDGSTDGSAEILEKYTKIDSRFYIVHQQNAGVGNARNVALNIMKGEWVVFCDGDDMLHPEALEWYANCVVRYTNISCISISKEEILRGEKLDLTEFPSLPEVNSAVFSDSIDSLSYSISEGGVWRTVFKSEMLKESNLRFKNYKVGEDTLFTAEFFWNNPNRLLVHGPFYFYRTRPSSAVHSNISFEKVRDWLIVENMVVSLIVKNSDRWTYAKMNSFFMLLREKGWMTFLSFFPRASLTVMRQCMPLWLSLQKKIQLLIPYTPYRRFVVVFLSIFPSAFLCKLLILGPREIKKIFKHLCFALK